MKLERNPKCRLNKKSRWVESVDAQGRKVMDEEVEYLPCAQLDCTMFIHIRGLHPQTGEQIDEYDCCFNWLPVLLIENSQQTRQAGAAIESFRNEMVKMNEQEIPQQFFVLPSMEGQQCAIESQ